MKSWAVWTARTVLVTTGFVAAGGGLAGEALASAPGSTSAGVYLPVSSGLAPGGMSSGQGLRAGNISGGSGNNVQIPVSIPLNVCGNAAAVLGDSSAGCVGGASAGDPVQRRAAVGHRFAGSAVQHPSTNQLVGLGALPGIANLGGPTGLPLSGLPGGGAPLPGNTLSSYQTDQTGQGGMSNNSFATLAIGALLAGVAALKLAGGRPRPRSAKAKGVPA